MRRQTRILLWRIAALCAFAAGAVGIVMPVLPTVPFFIVAAWAGSKGWPALERWLLNHRTYGPVIRRWRERGSVPRRAKWLATATMLASAVIVQFMPVPQWVRAGLPVVLVVVTLWLWTRPED